MRILTCPHGIPPGELCWACGSITTAENVTEREEMETDQAKEPTLEGKADAIRQKFCDAPAFYVVALLVITPFGVAATSAMYSRLKSKDTQPPSAQTVSPVSRNPAQQQASMPMVMRPTPDSHPVTNRSARPIQTKRNSLATPQISSPVPLTAAPHAVPTQQPTYGSQTCVGSACAQGPNSQATYPPHDEYSCDDPRRVLMTTQGGQHLCILFPEVIKP